MGCCKKNGSESMYVHTPEVKKRSTALVVLKWISITLFVLSLLGFIFVFVVLPIIFMESIAIQRYLMFPNYDQPDDPQYENYELYDAEGVRNFYVTVDDILNSSRSISLGVWQIVPEERIEASKEENFDYMKELKVGTTPIVIYFHGQSGTRIFPLPTYNVLRKFFHVLAFDYRSYGDSTEGLLTESAVVSDAVQFYNWVARIKNNRTDMFVWGHSLGTALSTHTIKTLTDKKFAPLPKALVLEAPFTTMREEVIYHPYGKFFNWLPWFNATILDPLEDNGFLFRTSTNIKSVNCPIMILHAEDDSVIPFELGVKLAKIATTERNVTMQGNVTLHVIPASARSDHMNINQYPELPTFISEFLKTVNRGNQRIVIDERQGHKSLT